MTSTKKDPYAAFNMLSAPDPRVSNVTFWLVIVLGAIGGVLWNWVVLPVAIVVAFAWRALTTRGKIREVEHASGLSMSEQVEMLKSIRTEMLVARNGGYDAKSLWPKKTGDLALGLHYQIKQALIEQEAKSGLVSEQTQAVCGRIAAGISNTAAWMVGKEVVRSTGDESIAQEVEEYGAKIEGSRALLSNTQIERAELYGVVSFMAMTGKSIAEMVERTSASQEDISNMLRDTTWIVGEK